MFITDFTERYTELQKVVDLSFKELSEVAKGLGVTGTSIKDIINKLNF